MKLFAKLLICALVITAVAGCRKKPSAIITPLPAGMTGSPTDQNAGPALGVDPTKLDNAPLGNAADGTAQQSNPDERKNWQRDSEIFKGDTVHFDYDSSVVKAAEKSKVAAVADHLKANPLDALEVDGHADERGTEEYNRSLGERRALALRDELMRLGVAASRIDTTSYGKDRPVDTGHDEAAHRKNRRGEFLLEMHPK
jgi:peptidoglycan-associated lipoprotein